MKTLLKLLILLLTLSSITITANASYKAYGYCACEKCCGKTDKITYSETIAREGRTIATDAKYLGKTALIYEDGVLIGIYECEDVGGDIKGNVIDVYHEKHSDALKFGVHECEVIFVDAKG